jgi:7-cyano-7-deazaguanine synthase in queuosine biosynthesis
MEGDLEDLVLFSGGIDSSVVALMLNDHQPELLFVDYGQPARCAERHSARALSELWGLTLSEVSVLGIGVDSGEIPGRNALLIQVAVAHRPAVRRVHIGIHTGTAYRDCSPAFVEVMQTCLDFHTDGRLRLSAPLISFSKDEVVTLGRSLDLPFGVTHSCETADEPCGACPTCRDLEALGVG